VTAPPSRWRDTDDEDLERAAANLGINCPDRPGADSLSGAMTWCIDPADQCGTTTISYCTPRHLQGELKPRVDV